MRLLATVTNKKKRKNKRAQMASNAQQLLEVVERLGLTGADAINFIREQQELAQAERLEAREEQNANDRRQNANDRRQNSNDRRRRLKEKMIGT